MRLRKIRPKKGREGGSSLFIRLRARADSVLAGIITDSRCPPPACQPGSRTQGKHRSDQHQPAKAVNPKSPRCQHEYSLSLELKAHKNKHQRGVLVLTTNRAEGHQSLGADDADNGRLSALPCKTLTGALDFLAKHSEQGIKRLIGQDRSDLTTVVIDVADSVNDYVIYFPLSPPPRVTYSRSGYFRPDTESES